MAGSWFLSRELDLLALGEETASSLGLHVPRARLQLILIATLAASAAVGAGGLIGFVGLVAPHVCRQWVGPRHRLLIPASALGGACLVLAADLPSGLDADTGNVLGKAVQATHTVTFAGLKPGLLTMEGRRLANRITVADIGVPRELLARFGVARHDCPGRDA